MSGYQKLFFQASEKLIPLHVIIELTYRCNLSCRHCYLSSTAKIGNIEKYAELSLYEWQDILDQLVSIDTLFLTFTGGEPFLHSDFFHILEAARERRFALRIFTNGTMINRKTAYQISCIAPFEIEITLLSSRPEIHDWFTNQPGSFHSTIKGIRELRNAGLKVNLKTPLLTINKNEIPSLQKLAEDLDSPIYFSPILSPCDNGDLAPLKHQLNASDLLSCLKEIRPPSPLQNSAPTSPPTPDKPLCGAGKNMLAISPWGETFPCIQIRKSAGNLKTESLFSIWNNSPTLKEIRKLTLASLPTCNSCSLLPYCILCPGMPFTLHQDVGYPYLPSCLAAKALAEYLS